MKKTLCVFAAALFMGSAAWAEKIDQGEAYRIASEFFGGSIGRKLAPATEPTPKLALAKATDAYYAFNRGTSGGYVIVAADDRAANEVLGFADSGTFSADSMPGAMRWWLDEYGRQIEYAASQPQGKPRLKRVLPVYDAIEPMVTARWDQGDPYNALCPSVGGEKCVTGCVATAWAQLMYYHKWPLQGTGSHSYSWNNGYYDEMLSVDFSQSVYDWDSMTDTYGENSTEASRNAVAKLMYDVGVASEMSYAPSSSGAQDITSGMGIINYFGYDKSMQLLQRKYYGIEEWQELVYGSLADDCPVYYSGMAGDGSGHAFVCDGYRDGYFHINWGWGGMSDGYFLLSALDPHQHGIGGATSGYNIDQWAAIGMRPAKGNTQLTPIIYCEGELDFEQASTHPSSTVTLKGGFYNNSLGNIDVTMGIKVVNAATGSTQYIASGYSTELGKRMGYETFDFSLSSFPKTYGTYRIYPAFRDTNRRRWYDIRTKRTSPTPYLLATVSSNGVKLEKPEIAGNNVAVTNFRQETPAYFLQPFKLSATLTNNSGEDFYHNVGVVLLDAADETLVDISMGENLIVLADGQSVDVEFKALGYFSGLYVVGLVNLDTNELLSDLIYVSFGVASTDPALLYMFDAPTMDYEGLAVADDIRFTAEVNCLMGSYFDNIYAAVFQMQPYEPTNVAMLTSDLYVNEGESGVLNFSGSIPGAAVGNEYRIVLYYLDENGELSAIPSNNNELSFTIGKLTPVEEVEAEASQPHDIEVYTLAGVRVLTQKGAKADLSSLPAGVYIVKEGGKVSRVAKR